jgi:hypothetical protein
MGQARNWTKAEKEYLEDNWGMKSIPAIAKNLNRSINAIQVMKDRLGLGSFLENGEYITFNQLRLALGITGGVGYMLTSWVKNRAFPVKTKRVKNNSFRVVYLNDFWKWADKNRSFLDWSRVEKNILGEEPGWVDDQRKIDFRTKRIVKMTPWTPQDDADLKRLLKEYKYNWPDLARRLQRTEGAIQRRILDLKIKDRPLKAENHIKWTSDEVERLTELINRHTSYELMADELGKSAKAIRGKVYSLCGTEDIDKAAQMLHS